MDARRASQSALASEHTAALAPVTGEQPSVPADPVVPPPAAAVVSAVSADVKVPDVAGLSDAAVFPEGAAPADGTRAKVAMFASGMALEPAAGPSEPAATAAAPEAEADDGEDPMRYTDG